MTDTTTTDDDATDATDIDTDEPATEQFDLEMGRTTDIDAADIHEFAAELEDADTLDTDAMADGDLADLVAACKRLGDAAEDARKDVFEPALDDRADEGETVGPVRRQRGTRRYVTDDAAAFDAVLDAGHDPREVASVNVGDLEDVLGADARDHLGETTYSYYRRVD